MFQDQLAHPERLEQHSALLADLHSRLHRVGIVHRDLDPFNVILGKPEAILIDWEAPGEGDAATDLAETWILLATADLEPKLRVSEEGL
jgi:thiamine kinase-like enzyme